MIKLKDIKDKSALELLKVYKGKNPYILIMQREFNKNGKLRLTENQSKYIIDNFNKEPIKINRVIEISEFLGEELKKKENLSFTPKRILIQYILAETEKTLHIYGKVKQNQKKSKMYWLPKTQIIDDPYLEPIDIDIDFQKYIELDTLHRKPYNHQKEGIKFLLSRNGCILADDMGLGKMLSSDTKVLTPNGWVEHGSLKVGDYVIGSNGKPTKVLKVNPTVKKDFYKITFSDGTIVESCDEHLWAVQTTNHRISGKGFIVKQLKDLMGDLRYGNKENKGKIKWYIPMVKPVEFNHREVKIDPYLLGCLLGNADISTHNIKLSTKHLELLNECSIRLPENHIFKRINDCFDYDLINNTPNNLNYIVRSLSEYNLIGTKSETKFIPEDYKYNSKDIRLNILQGLLDCNGYSLKNGTIKYYSTSKQLSDDVKELVQSFGGIAKQSIKTGRYKLLDGIIKERKEYFILTINLPEGIIPFKLESKISNMRVNCKLTPTRGIKSIEYSRTTEGQCISVESDDHLYVMDQYVVTHNTYQAVIAALESSAEKILIVCPSSLKINWEREINMFSDQTSIISGTKWKPNKFTIINYDILKNFHSLNKRRGKKVKPTDPVIEFRQDIANHKFDLCIIDEAHYLKNPKSIRGKIMTDLCINHGINKVWLLTGTPIANRPMDYFNLLRIIKAPIADNWMFFAKRYCEGKKFFKTLQNGQRKQIWLTDGASNLDELSNKTKNIILRRKKEDVLDMPEKTIIPVLQELSKKAWEEYNELWDEYIDKKREEAEKNGMEFKNNTLERDLIELILLRQFIAMEAIPYTIELAEDAIEQNQKVIIFTNFTDELLELQKHFGNQCVVHYGALSAKEKQSAVDDFMTNPKVKVFIGNIKSAGVGINLTVSNIVIFNSFDWVPGNNEQAEDRAYRIGQNNNVTVYYQLFKDTISLRMWSILQNKKEIISIIMGDTSAKEISEEERIILNYIEQLKKDENEKC